MYADDHHLYEIGEDRAKVKSSLSGNAEKASRWYEVNRLKGNFSKYKTMLMHNNDKVTTYSAFEYSRKWDRAYGQATSISDHINSITKKANQRIRVLMRLKNLIPTAAKLQMHKAAILPHLSYCHLSWHFCREGDRS